VYTTPDCNGKPDLFWRRFREKKGNAHIERKIPGVIKNWFKKTIFAVMKQLRKILFPFSVLYDGVTRLRNFLYNQQLLKSHSFTIPVVCVGNLSTGGTGKTPMVEYLIRKWQNDYKMAVLSRGYGRKTRGFRWVSTNDLPEFTGDEPLQIKKKFPEITVAVDENRVRGIRKLEKEHQLIVLDDAFQHRRVKPTFTILLTAYGDLYTNDLLLPAGNLRESAQNARRADVIVITKCRPHLSVTEKEKIRAKIRPTEKQQLLFSHLTYSSDITNNQNSKPISTLKDQPFTLVTGIANPKPLVAYLHSLGLRFTHLSYPDHHLFSTQEINRLQQQPFILTTEKDFVRLDHQLDNQKLYYIPVAIELDSTLDFKIGQLKK